MGSSPRMPKFLRLTGGVKDDHSLVAIGRSFSIAPSIAFGNNDMANDGGHVICGMGGASII